MFQCPLCGKEAKTQGGLAKHLRGTTKYGGHERSATEAVSIAAEVGHSVKGRLSGEPPKPIEVVLGEITETERQGFFFASLSRVVDNKDLPKYQFERVIDFCLGTFLPDIFTSMDGAPTRLVTQELPLKKDVGNQSTNLDYVLLQDETQNSPGRWLFVELKTDSGSIRYRQNEIYQRLLLGGASMSSLIRDLKTIQSASLHPAKYDEALGRFEGQPLDLPIQLVYLSPNRQQLELDPHRYRTITFEELRTPPPGTL